MAEFIDCGTVSIQYDTTGRATISFVVVTDSDRLSASYTSLSFGGINFIGVIMSAVQRPILGSGDDEEAAWFEWQMTLQGVGN